MEFDNIFSRKNNQTRLVLVRIEIWMVAKDLELDTVTISLAYVVACKM